MPSRHTTTAAVSGSLSAAGQATDHTLPEGQWRFDEDVAGVFDNMLERSIPQYSVMRDAVASLTARLLAARPPSDQLAVVDLGCSRGGAIASVRDMLRQRPVRYFGFDISPPMLAAARQRFEGAGDVLIAEHDLREGYPSDITASATLAVLTLQFIPLEYRQGVVSQMHASTEPGGFVIVVEKVLGATSRLNDAMVAEYLEMKRLHGYSDTEIERKRLSLEGVLMPITESWTADMLRSAGFREIDTFWRWMNFAGWIAVRS